MQHGILMGRLVGHSAVLSLDKAKVRWLIRIEFDPLRHLFW